MRRLLYSLVLASAVSLIIADPSTAARRNLFYYQSPLPGATLVSRQTTLIFRPTADLVQRQSGWMDAVVVEGSMSGPHSGNWIAARDSRTFIFEPHQRFEPGEVVHVSMAGVVSDGDGALDGLSDRGYSYSFTISTRTAVPEERTLESLCECIAPTSSPQTRGDRGEDLQVLPRVVLPPAGQAFELPTDFPEITVTVSDDTAPGHIFVSNFRFADGANQLDTRYLMVLDNSGVPVFFRHITGLIGLDFKKQPDGRLSYFVIGPNYYYLMDNTYEVVDSITTQGYPADIHDLQILPNGHSLIMAHDDQPMDMSQIVEGGDPEAIVIGLIVQELDVDKNLVFEWRSWDHFDILDATHLDYTASRIDYVHVNSIELDHDGHILISNRHMDEITKINRDTGEIIWRMGGKNNEFTLINDTIWFSHQHSCRRQPNGTITLHDNGNFNTPSESRAVEYEVDEVNKTITLVWEYRNDPAILGTAMGSQQRLSNGSVLISWGNTNPNATEIRPDGSKVFEMTFPAGVVTYRGFRFEWEAVAARPYLWVNTVDETITLHFTKFGDAGVEAYNIYRGDEPSPTELSGSTGSTRFVVHNYNAGETMYFRVTALDASGNESPFSNEIAVTPDFSNLLQPTTVEINPETLNLTSNGKWITAYIEMADTCECSVADVDVSSIMLNGLVPAERHPTAIGDEDEDDIPDLMVKFSRRAVANVLTVGDSVEISVTGSIGNATFEARDYIRVIRGGQNATTNRRGRLVLYPNRPNPFNPSTVIGYEVPPGSAISIKIYDVAGRLVATLMDQAVSPGTGSVTWNGRDNRGRIVPSGVYFYKLHADGTAQTRKMILMK
ncbi:MAG: aryl-sulfate sulfotransferase [Candidatus Krumholzibacteriota bacterium]|nr:aryl-sulfate sulfotransferase [Candidatus Krumholzibacteriota bacterium]